MGQSLAGEFPAAELSNLVKHVQQTMA